MEPGDTASATGLRGYAVWSLPHPSTLPARRWDLGRRFAGSATAGELIADENLKEKPSGKRHVAMQVKL